MSVSTIVWFESGFLSCKTFIDLLYDAQILKYNFTAGVCTHGNLSINAILCYEIKVLLQNSQRVLRSKQPSLTRVNILGVTAYLFPAILYSGVFFRPSAFTWIVFGIGWLPILYAIHVTIFVWCHGYIPSTHGATPSAKATRELAFYFYRISGTFVGIWIPAMAIHLYGAFEGEDWPTFVAFILGAIQPIVTFCVILKKSDTKKYIVKLVTLSYLFSNWPCRCHWNDTRLDRNVKRRFSSILGFNVESTAEQADADGDARASRSAVGISDGGGGPGGDIEFGKRPNT
jgi:hypothetical protein